MKKSYPKSAGILLLCLCIRLITYSQMKIGDNVSSINSASLLELETTNKGFVLPRVSLTSVASTSPLPAGLLNGTVVFNTNSSVTGGNGTGLYVWNTSSSAWIPVTPNYGSGTTDYVARWTSSSALGTGLIRDNNTSVGINTAPVSTEMLTVSGGASLNGINATSVKTTSGSFAIKASSTTNVTGYLGYVGSITVAGVTVTNPAAYFTSTSNNNFSFVATTTGSANTPAIMGLSGIWHGGYFATGTNNAKGVYAINTTSGAYAFGGGDGVYGETGQQYAYGVEAKNTNSNGIAVYGQNSVSKGSNNGIGVLGETKQNGGFGVWGINDNSTGTGVLGGGNNQTSTYLTNGSGGSFTGLNTGLFALAKDSSGNGFISIGNNGSTITTLTGGSGGTLIGDTTGVFGLGKSTTIGTGVIGAGNNASAQTIPGGSGGAFTGTSTGSYSIGTASASGTGVVGSGNNQSAMTDASGSGGAFTGSTDGVFAYATSTSQGAAAIKTYNAATGGNVYVNYLSDGTLGSAGTSYKIIGTGTVSTIVKDNSNRNVALHAPEAPEIYFEDYGEGQLINGKVHINIDPLFAKNIVVNDKHPLRVFVQLYGDCKGVFVSNTSANGFDVTELQGGTSNTPFQWHIVCNRADEILPNGNVSRNADVRFEPVEFNNSPNGQSPFVSNPAISLTENNTTTLISVSAEERKPKKSKDGNGASIVAPEKKDDNQ